MDIDQFKADQAHRWLDGIETGVTRVDELREQVAWLRDRASGLKGIDYSEQRVSGGGAAPDRMADAIAQVDAAIARYCEAIAELTAEQADAHRRLSALPPDERGCLVRHYLLAHDWVQVCGEMRYSYGGMMKLRRRALVSAYGVMPAADRDPVPRALIDRLGEIGQ